MHLAELMASLFRRRRSSKEASAPSQTTPKSPTTASLPEDTPSLSSASLGGASGSSETTASRSPTSSMVSEDPFELALKRPLPPSRLVSYSTVDDDAVGMDADVYPEDHIAAPSAEEVDGGTSAHSGDAAPPGAPTPDEALVPASDPTPPPVAASTPSVTIPYSPSSRADDTASISSSAKFRKKGFWRRGSSSKASSSSLSGSSPSPSSGFKSSQLSPIPSSSAWPPAYDPRDYSPSLAEKDEYGFSAHPPTYHPSEDATTYEFSQTGPFTMALTSSAGGVPAYHISVGLNVWMPSSTVTYLRRGGEDGPLVAQLEMGIAAGLANVTFADECRTLGNVMFRKSAGSSSRYYFTGDGTIIRWKLGDERWEALCQSAPLALFTPGVPRTLAVRDYAHPLLDHLVLALLVLMREHLTPLAALSGDAAGLFNYGAGAASKREELANQDW